MVVKHYFSSLSTIFTGIIGGSKGAKIVPATKDRFRGFLPIVIDIETSGLDYQTNAILEICAIPITYQNLQWEMGHCWHEHVLPFDNAVIDESAFQVHGIIPDHPFRQAISETDMINKLADHIKQLLKKTRCFKAILVGHNAHFDLSFLQAAISRSQVSQFPMHPFTTIDTATLGAFLHGETVLAKILRKSKVPYSINEAHSAYYDAVVTAKFFCKALNQKKS